jgi:hypothetical protein
VPLLPVRREHPNKNRIWGTAEERRPGQNRCQERPHAGSAAVHRPDRDSGRADRGRENRVATAERNGALPPKQADKFRTKGEVAPPAYVYEALVDPDPNHDATPAYTRNPMNGLARGLRRKNR